MEQEDCKRGTEDGRAWADGAWLKQLAEGPDPEHLAENDILDILKVCSN
jgi:hypothetical protein